MLKRWIRMLPVLACTLLLSSCSLLPEEEIFADAPVIKQFSGVGFKLAQVEKSDMVQSERIYCTYVPVQTETLKYSVGGLYFGETFVEVGDSVTKGQLLAQLDMSGIDSKLDACRLQIEKLGIRMAALEENRALALERQRLMMREAAEEELNEALAEVDRQYDRQKQSLMDELTIAQLQQAEYEEEVARRQLRAGFDGTVTHVRKTQEGERSTAGERGVTVADSTMSLFRAETGYWDRFKPGDEYIITVSKVEYEAIVTSEEELGIPVTEKTEGRAGYVYLRLKYPSFELEDGDKGTLELILDERKGVMTVPKSAVSQAGDIYIVYCQDEDGMKTYKQVEIGLSANNKVEILSGLSEGESVIVR